EFSCTWIRGVNDVGHRPAGIPPVSIDQCQPVVAPGDPAKAQACPEYRPWLLIERSLQDKQLIPEIGFLFGISAVKGFNPVYGGRCVTTPAKCTGSGRDGITSPGDVFHQRTE